MKKTVLITLVYLFILPVPAFSQQEKKPVTPYKINQFEPVEHEDLPADLQKEDEFDSKPSDDVIYPISEDEKYESAPKEQGVEAEQTAGSVTGRVEGTQRRVSELVLGTANTVDSFFGDPRTVTESNTTKIRLRFDVDIEENDEFELRPRVRINLSLPYTNNKLHFFINGDEGDDETISDLDNNEEAGSFFLRYFWVNNDWSSLALDGGLRIRSSTLEFFGGVRGRVYRTWELWGFRLTNRLRWFTKAKWQNRTDFDIERVILKRKSFFRSRTNGDWFQDRSGYFVEQRFSYFHQFNEKWGIVPEWVTIGETQIDDFFKETRFRFRIRHNWIWDWLFVEVGPGIVFREKYDWDPEWAIRFRVDIYFGKFSDVRFFN